MSHWINYQVIFRDAIIFENWNLKALEKEIKFYFKKMFIEKNDFDREFDIIYKNIEIYKGDVLCKNTLINER